MLVVVGFAGCGAPAPPVVEVYGDRVLVDSEPVTTSDAMGLLLPSLSEVLYEGVEMLKASGRRDATRAFLGVHGPSDLLGSVWHTGVHSQWQEVCLLPTPDSGLGEQVCVAPLQVGGARIVAWQLTLGPHEMSLVPFPSESGPVLWSFGPEWTAQLDGVLRMGPPNTQTTVLVRPDTPPDWWLPVVAHLVGKRGQVALGFTDSP